LGRVRLEQHRLLVDLFLVLTCCFNVSRDTGDNTVVAGYLVL
jgi:hypothetical protein